MDVSVVNDVDDCIGGVVIDVVDDITVVEDGAEWGGKVDGGARGGKYDRASELIAYGSETLGMATSP